MFAKAVLIPLMIGAGQITIGLGPKPKIIEQPKYPIERYGPLWAEICDGSDDAWDKAAPPVRVHGNTYYVGTCGISSILIAGDDGLILIDGGTEKSGPAVAANIAKLGYDIRNLRFILTSHEHYDHAGGIAYLQEQSGASLVTSGPAARVFMTGKADPDDPQAGSIPGFPTASVGRVVRDGDQVRLGNIMVEAIATPGHTPGAMSWRWISCDGGVCRTIVYADSLSAVSRDGYRFSDHAKYLAVFRASIAKIANSRCDIVLSPHPSATHMRERFAKGEKLLDPNGCKDYAASLTKRLDDRLAQEAAATPRKK